MEEIERRVRDAVADLSTRPGLADVEVIDCDPALADTAAFCEAYGYAPDDSANAILVAGKGGADPPPYALCVVLATTRLDVNRVVRRRLGTKKASFAPADVTTEVTGMTPGGVTPIAVPDGLPVWIDTAVMARSQILIGGGSRSCKVVGPPAMLLEAVAGAEVVEDLATRIS